LLSLQNSLEIFEILFEFYLKTDFERTFVRPGICKVEEGPLKICVKLSLKNSERRMECIVATLELIFVTKLFGALQKRGGGNILDFKWAPPSPPLPLCSGRLVEFIIQNRNLP
jgi:hypothetical protein